MIKYVLLVNCLAVVSHVAKEVNKLEKYLESRTDAVWSGLPAKVRNSIDAGENLFI